MFFHSRAVVLEYKISEVESGNKWYISFLYKGDPK